MGRTGFAAVLGLLLMTSPAWAADGDANATVPEVRTLILNPVQPSGRGPVLPLLYGTLAGLQAYDGWSTLSAVQRGATEANPALGGVASNSGAMWAVKAGATVASIYAAERLWRRHRRVEAVVTMVAVNGLMAAVATHNASVLRGLK